MYHIVDMNVGDWCTRCTHRWGRQEVAVPGDNHISPNDLIRVMQHMVTMYPTDGTNVGALCVWCPHRWSCFVPVSFRPHVVTIMISRMLLSTYMHVVDKGVCMSERKVRTVWQRCAYRSSRFFILRSDFFVFKSDLQASGRHNSFRVGVQRSH